jgi:hypothetical protein
MGDVDAGVHVRDHDPLAAVSEIPQRRRVDQGHVRLGGRRGRGRGLRGRHHEVRTDLAHVLVGRELADNRGRGRNGDGVDDPQRLDIRDQALRLAELEQRQQPTLGEVGAGAQDPGRCSWPVLPREPTHAGEVRLRLEHHDRLDHLVLAGRVELLLQLRSHHGSPEPSHPRRRLGRCRTGYEHRRQEREGKEQGDSSHRASSGIISAGAGESVSSRRRRRSTTMRRTPALSASKSTHSATAFR